MSFIAHALEVSCNAALWGSSFPVAHASQRYRTFAVPFIAYALEVTCTASPVTAPLGGFVTRACACISNQEMTGVRRSGCLVQAFPAIAKSHMAKKAQLLAIWLRAMLDFKERESCFLLTNVSFSHAITVPYLYSQPL